MSDMIQVPTGGHETNTPQHKVKKTMPESQEKMMIALAELIQAVDKFNASDAWQQPQLEVTVQARKRTLREVMDERK